MAPALKILTLFGACSLVQSNVISSTKPTPPGTFELLILHNNDMHARFEQTSQLSGICNTEDREAGKCYGGFPRVAHVVKEAREKAKTGEGPPVLYLNAGDTYTGTAWFTIYKWKIAAECLNALNPDAVSLTGSDSENFTSNYIKDIRSPVLAANVLTSNEDNKLVHKSVIFDVEGIKICIIGYVNPIQNGTKLLDDLYEDEILSIQNEINKNIKYNVNIFIALGHSQNNKHIEIAKHVVGLDLVIASTQSTNSYKSDNLIKVKQLGGKEVPVVYSYDFHNYVGQVKIYLDKTGVVVRHDVDRILLNNTIAKDKKAEKLINQLTSNRDNVIIGKTAVTLDGETCKNKECNLGNLIADSIVYHYALHFQGQYWTDASIAIIPNTNIASSIMEKERPSDLTLSDIENILPKKDIIMAATVPGKVLKNLLEEAVFYSGPNNKTNVFLQYSGIMVTYDLLQPPGQRVIRALARCSACMIPEFFEIDDRQYKVLIPKSFAESDLLVHSEISETLFDETTCLENYIKNRTLVYPDVAGRITLRNSFDEVIGTTAVTLDGKTCIYQECNLGNLITDAMIYYYATRHTGERWTDASIAIINSESIASSIVLSNVKSSEILISDLIKVLPKSNTITVVTMSGTVLMKLLEESVVNFNEIKALNDFMQYSGVRIIYDLSKSPGSRVLSATVRCSSCNIPQFYAIDDRQYKIMMPTSFAEHSLFDNLQKEVLNYNELICLKEYIEHKSPIYPDVSGRITLIDDLENNIVGKTVVRLDGDSCDKEECNLGNLITDAMIYYYAIQYTGNSWTDSPIAIVDSSFIGNSVSHSDLTLEDINNIIAKKENIVTVSISGSVLLKLLELPVTNNSATKVFLQYSGIRVLYDRLRPSGMRIVNAAARCWDCMVPELFEIEDRTYKILMHKSLSEHELLKNFNREELNFNGVICLKEYIQRRSPIYPDVSNRMTCVKNSEYETTTTESVPTTTDLPSNIIGKTVVTLDGDSCNTEECNIGNLITDAMIYHYAVNFDGEHWTDSPIAIIDANSIGKSISYNDLTVDDINNIFTNKDKIVAVTITGAVLLKLLDLPVSDEALRTNLFFQYSGIRILYDPLRPPEARIVRAAARCWDCKIPELFEIDDRLYKILMPKSLSNHELLINSLHEELDYDGATCLKEYIRRRSPIYPDVSGRITFAISEDETSSTTEPTFTTSSKTPPIQSTTESVPTTESISSSPTTTKYIDITTDPITDTTVIPPIESTTDESTTQDVATTDDITTSPDSANIIKPHLIILITLLIFIINY